MGRLPHFDERCCAEAIKQRHEMREGNEGRRSRARLHAPRSLQLRKYLEEPSMEGINIMPGSIRPVSANCAAGTELKEAMGCKIEKERERERRVQQRKKEEDEKES